MAERPLSEEARLIREYFDRFGTDNSNVEIAGWIATHHDTVVTTAKVGVERRRYLAKKAARGETVIEWEPNDTYTLRRLVDKYGKESVIAVVHATH